ncbi:hypothetical protein [Crateriforma conspicua]|uniref:hypothetical protein n=1 Tax=Crateriforma conspicua TaxID=2527996 RepID=UPI00118C2BAC|nr:hypothetical protein [Crateriforma conspicua]QDV66097.1 hypothetical protein Mal65_52700 [Crateriforma conspicua]
MNGLTDGELREWDTLLGEIQRNPNHQQRMLSQLERKLLALDLEERLRVAKIRAAGLESRAGEPATEAEPLDGRLTQKQRDIRAKLKRLQKSH